MCLLIISFLLAFNSMPQLIYLKNILKIFFSTFQNGEKVIYTVSCLSPSTNMDNDFTNSKGLLNAYTK